MANLTGRNGLCTDLEVAERLYWSVFEETSDCIPGEALFNNAVYNVDFIQQLTIAGASTIANLGVLYYYIVAPVHPKFLLRLPRKISIITHTVAGTVEICSGIIAFFIVGEYVQLFCQIMAIASWVHVITGFYQTPIVFGLQAFMVPAYSFVLLCKLLCAISLFLTPYCYIRLVVLYNVLSIYAWCRAFIGSFLLLGIFEKSHYSIGILLAGGVCLPGLGPAAVWAGITYVFVWMLFLRFCSNEFYFSVSLNENAANPFDNASFEYIFNHSIAPPMDFGGQGDHNSGDTIDVVEAEKKEEVRRLFNAMDTQNLGYITKEDVRKFRLAIKEPKVYNKIKIYFDQAGGKEVALKFEKKDETDTPGFYEFAKGKVLSHKIPSLVERITEIEEMSTGTDLAKKQKLTRQAKLVFDILDTASSGYLTTKELGIVLLEFGLPASEVYLLFIQYASSEDGMNFSEFYKSMKPLWIFAYREFKKKLEDEKKRGNKHKLLKESISKMLLVQKEKLEIRSLRIKQRSGGSTASDA